MNRWILKLMKAVLAAVAFFLGGLIGAVVLFSGSLKARAPAKWERKMAVGVKRWILVGDRRVKNPLAATAQNIVQGQKTFSHYCFACHGLDGQKTGVPFADSMSPPIPSLSAPGVQAYTDGQLYWIIRNGLFPSGMPGADGILTNDEAWSIVLYLRHLPPAGSLGEPSAYSGSGRGSPTRSSRAAPSHGAMPSKP